MSGLDGVGFVVIGLALAGVVLCRDAPLRAVLVLLWLGYLGRVVWLVMRDSLGRWHHPDLVPLVAISIAPAAAPLLNRLETNIKRPRWRAAVALGLLLVIAGPVLSHVAEASIEETDRAFILEIVVAFTLLDALEPTTTALVLPRSDAAVSAYFGHYAAVPWPRHGELASVGRRGLHVPSARDRIEHLRATFAPDIFVVTAPWELPRQGGLRALLEGEHTLAIDSPFYKVFELTGP